MSTAVSTAGFTSTAFDAFLDSRNEPDWLIEQRRAAWRKFEELPMPSRGDEEWMRTDMRLFHPGSVQIPLRAKRRADRGSCPTRC